MRNHNEALDNSQKVQFPWKLHAILEETETCGHDAIISWLPNGLGFKVHDKDAFAEEVMPKYFSSNKFKTFQRNLNLWGFQTLTRDPDRGAAFHPHFIRGKPDECNQMERVRVKKEMKHKKVILKPTGELEPLCSSPSQSPSAAPSSPRSQSSQLKTIKVISPTSTPPLVPGTIVSPKCMAPGLSLPRKVSVGLPHSNEASNNNSFSLNLRNQQDFSDTIVSPKAMRLDLSLQPCTGGLPNFLSPSSNSFSQSSNVVPNSNCFSLNVQTLQNYIALECLRAASLNHAGSGSSIIY
ncbi:unnamed protein product [Cylindrotheca closterium]|uniref:HSF-type DNA-binding domain-containing protein n=1 Tax=Cylindrotheca closterium TaxID=2856 RepID=A0AAD2CNY8_9STRA|nr:unnamed protein product [Cylindrotheca closterium]